MQSPAESPEAIDQTREGKKLESRAQARTSPQRHHAARSIRKSVSPPAQKNGQRSRSRRPSPKAAKEKRRKVETRAAKTAICRRANKRKLTVRALTREGPATRQTTAPSIGKRSPVGPLRSAAARSALPTPSSEACR